MKHLLSLLLFIGVITVQAQNPNDANQPQSEEDKIIAEITREYYVNLAQIMNSKDKSVEPVTRFLDKDFTGTRHIFDVDGNQTKSTITLNEYRAQLDAQQSIPNLQVSYEIERINFVHAYDNFGTINYSLLISASISGEVVLRFKSFVTNYLRKDASGQWKIFESSGINVYKEQEIGICPYAITKPKDENQYLVKILSPAGNSFNTDNLLFAFKQADKMELVTCGNNAYTFVNNEVTCIKENGKTASIKLGKAANKVELINLVLSNQLYKTRCIGFKMLSK